MGILVIYYSLSLCLLAEAALWKPFYTFFSGSCVRVDWENA
jgi:hypothetical protein